MKLISENQLLSLAFRKAVIQEISGVENIRRKNEALRRHEVYRDNTIKWVIESLIREGLAPETIAIMRERAANISICRKIIDKLARCYSGGVSRESSSEKQKEFFDLMGGLVCIDSRMKKADRYRELQKNCLAQVVPERAAEEGDGTKFIQRIKILPPWQYDAIEDAVNREQAKCIILSEFVERNQLINQVPQSIGSTLLPSEGDSIDQIIADSPSDAGLPKKTFIWWGKQYHFTTDEHGAIIPALSPPDLLNPIQILPFVNIHDDQDGQFWAEGGQDIIDGSILVNKTITDMNAIAYLQGFGQLVITGRNIPKKLTIGPHHALILNYDAGDPEPKVNFASASSHLDVWMQMIEQYVALLLSTNDLSSSSVSAKLDVGNMASGVAKLIDQSDATGSIEDQQRQCIDKEKEVWKILQAWQNLMFDRQALTKEFQKLGPMTEELDLNIKFNAVKPPMSEKEKLENIKLREELGINTKIDLILIDNPGMTQEQAEEKLVAIAAEKLADLSLAMSQAVDQAALNQEKQIDAESTV